MTIPRRALRIGGAALLLVALLVLAASYALPPWLHTQAQQRLSTALGRPVTITAIDWQPFRLAVTIRGLSIGAAPGAGNEAQLAVERLFVQADLASVRLRAPVIRALEIDGLRARMARVAAEHYDIDDVVARLAQPPAAPGDEQPVRFALHNLQLRDAALRFDDRPAGRVHTLDALTLSLPFLSNLAADIATTVEPRLRFKLNGSAFDSGAQATPFALTRQGDIKLAVSQLDAAPYLGYLPSTLPVRLQKTVLAGEVRLNFAQPPGAAPRVALSGWVEARDLALVDAGGAALAAWSLAHLDLRDVQPLARRVALGDLKVDGLVLDIVRGADGVLNVQRLGSASAPSVATAAVAPSASAAAGATPAAPWQLQLERLDLPGARVRWTDASLHRPSTLDLAFDELHAAKIAWPLQAPAEVSVKANLRVGPGGGASAGRFGIQGSASDQAAALALQLEGLSLPALAPYLAPLLTPKVSGTLAAAGQLKWSAGAAPKLDLAFDSIRLDGLRLTEPAPRDGKPEDTLASKQVAAHQLDVDLLAHRVAIGRVQISQPTVHLRRNAQSQWNVAAWAAESAPPARGAPAPRRPAPAAPPGTPWTVKIDDLALQGGQLRLSDVAAALPAPVRVEVSSLAVGARGLGWPLKSPVALRVAARVGAAGRGNTSRPSGAVGWRGRIGLAPLQAEGELRMDRFPVALFVPYVAYQLPLGVPRAEASYKGRIAFTQEARGARVEATGDVLLGDVLVQTRPGPDAGAPEELLSWQTLALDGLSLQLVPGGRPNVALRSAVLSDFYSRLVVSPEGRFNLQDVAGAAPAASAASAAAPAASAAATTTPSPLPFELFVQSTRIVNGRVDFTDHFVKPNYSSRLSDLNGQLGAYRAGSPEMAALEIHGRAAGTANLDIVGQLNPTANPPAMDLEARATDLELAPFSPYSGKYAGYAIERGKLSATLRYKISSDGRLEAQNQLIVNQLTFGDRVESAEATKLPVRLAVALLRDRNGVIDLNLPVSGSLRDPQFSLGGLIWKVIVNLFTKVITSPFALLGGSGEGGDDLSLIEFQPGSALPSEGGMAALDKVARALLDRPALQMTVTGAAEAAVEGEAMQRLALDARLLALRKRQQARAGVAAPPSAAASAVAAAAAATETPVFGAEERARLLRDLYRETTLPDKPRNALGFARDIPPAEMEALLRRAAPISSDQVRDLALQRGVAVREVLVAKGLPSARLFLAAPQLQEGGDGSAQRRALVKLELSHP